MDFTPDALRSSSQPSPVQTAASTEANDNKIEFNNNTTVYYDDVTSQPPENDRDTPSTSISDQHRSVSAGQSRSADANRETAILSLARSRRDEVG